VSVGAAPLHHQAFRHEALFYQGDTGFLAGTSSFIREAVAAGEPTLVVVSAAKIDMLRSELGGEAESVHFADMAEVGANPARIIPAWTEFAARHSAEGRSFRGIGEPIWKGRGPAELIECQRHESLLNVAFSGGAPWWLLCPYDTQALDPAVVDEAQRSHPFVMEGAGHRESGDYRGIEVEAAPFDAPLPEPSAPTAGLAFENGPLSALRSFVSRQAASAGLGAIRTADFVVAVNEVATNSLRFGGGRGTLRMWQEDEAIICEIHDGGHLNQPLVGRQRPRADQDSGRGLWLANHLCDLVQLRSFPEGTAVRAHLRRG